MSPIPSRVAPWQSATAYRSERIANLDHAIPVTFNRVKNSTNIQDAKAYARTLNKMLATLQELQPEHPHLNKYNPANI